MRVRVSVLARWLYVRVCCAPFSVRFLQLKASICLVSARGLAGASSRVCVVWRMADLGGILHVLEARACLLRYLCDHRVLVRVALASSMQEYQALRLLVLEVRWDWEQFLEWQDEQVRIAYQAREMQEFYAHHFPGVRWWDD